MKQGLESSSVKSYPSQLVVPHALLESFRIPNYVWVVTVILAMALLAVASVYREREGLRQATAAHAFIKQKLKTSELSNALTRREIASLKNDKDVIAQKAQEKLNYVRPNEVVLVLR